MKDKILKGIRHRINMLEQQYQMAYNAELEYIIRDTDSKLDELKSLENWIEGLKEQSNEQIQ